MSSDRPLPMTPIEDPIRIPPTLTSLHGRAWAVDIDGAFKRLGRSREEFGDVASWLIEASWAHPIWHSYWINLNHLRPVSGQMAPLHFYLEGATHEVWVKALDPARPRQAMIETGNMAPLQPGNFAAQIIERSDEAAQERIKDAVQLICQGKLSPDTDFLRPWILLFGDNMVKPEMRPDY